MKNLKKKITVMFCNITVFFYSAVGFVHILPENEVKHPNVFLSMQINVMTYRYRLHFLQKSSSAKLPTGCANAFNIQ